MVNLNTRENAPAPELPVTIKVAETREERLGEHDIRWRVFVEEQGVPWLLELDARDLDPNVIHVIAVDAAGHVVGAVRIIPDGGGHYHLGRLVVDDRLRGTGTGARLVKGVHDYVQSVTPMGEQAHVVLDGQVQALGFYRKLGYEETTGDVFLDAGIEHKEMAKVLEGAQTN